MKQAFTLVELLVVVLIIGVLTAIAIPQYQKAVLNSKMTQAYTLFGTYKQAIDMWLMENGWPDDYTGLSGTKGGGILGISTPLLSEQTTWYDCNRNLGMYLQAWCDNSYCGINLAGYGTNGWLGRCGLQFQRGSPYYPQQGDWKLIGIRYDITNAATKEQCPDVIKIACQYAKSNFSGYMSENVLYSQCSAAGITLQ